MEIVDPKNKLALSFRGKGSSYFTILFVNLLLTVLTLGLYYPWAKARDLQYLYSSSFLNEDNFIFHGTGKEMFKGFVKAILLFFALFAVLSLLLYFEMFVLGIILFYLGLVLIIPLAIHGSYRYRMSRTSWRGIRFGYRGDRRELFVNFLKWTFLSLITLGIYGWWFIINLRNYLLNHIRFGSLQFKYKGNGFDYFILNIKGIFLSIITLGVYSFWYLKELYAYYVDNLSIQKDEQKITFKSTATGKSMFVLMITNLLLIIFTLGFAYAWVVARTMTYVFSHIELEGNVDLNAIVQTEENYKDATGEDVSDFLDIDFVI